MATNTPSPVVTLPTLSDLLTVKTDTVTRTNERLFQQYLVSRSEAVVSLMEGVRRQKEVAAVTLAMYGHERIHEDVFLMSINNCLAVMSGFRCFLVNAVEYILQADGEASSKEGRSILLLAEEELEKEMQHLLDTVRKASEHSPNGLYWEVEKGLFFHTVNLALPGFGAW